MKKQPFCFLFSFVFLTAVLFAGFCFSAGAAESSGAPSPFSGSGTGKDPYVIAGKEDLLRLSQLVSEGEHFEGAHFVQECDIDLAGIEWLPIGEFGTDFYFDGIYDGNGHRIENLTTKDTGNNGLFGQLGGTLMNLTLAGGEIRGDCIGSFTSHAATSHAMIVNCCNHAAVSGDRAGGIADNFNGVILGCRNDGPLNGNRTGGIVSYSAQRVGYCHGTDNPDAETMNRYLMAVALEGNLRLSDLNCWEDTENGAELRTEKRHLSVRDLPMGFVFSLPYLFPVLLILGVSGCVVYITLYKRKKPQGQSSGGAEAEAEAEAGTDAKAAD